MRHLQGKVAVVTGASSGIGQALAIELARCGCRLAICGNRNIEGLARTEKEIRQLSVPVSTHQFDVADFESLRALPDEVLRRHGDVHLLVNNAGVGLVVPVKDMTIEDFQWLMDINFWSVVHCIQAFLPHMLAHESQIINVASSFAFWAAPGESAYTASKFALRGFGEALGQELYSTKVSVSTVYPGAVRTEIAKNARFGGAIGPLTDPEEAQKMFNYFARTSSPQAARAIVKGIRKNKRRILVGADAKLLDLIQRLFPSAYQRVFPLVFRL